MAGQGPLAALAASPASAAPTAGALPAFPQGGVIGPQAPIGGGNGLLPPLLMALGQLPQALEAHKRTQEADKTKATADAQALDIQKSEAAEQHFKSTSEQLSFYSQLGENDPSLAASPQYAQALDQAYQGLGLGQAPRTADGAVDISALRNHNAFAEWLAKPGNYTTWLGATPEERLAIKQANNFPMVPDAMMSVPRRQTFSGSQLEGAADGIRKAIATAGKEGLNPSAVQASILPQLRILKESGLYSDEDVNGILTQTTQVESRWLDSQIAKNTGTVKADLLKAQTALANVHSLEDYRKWQSEHGNQMANIAQQNASSRSAEVDSAIALNAAHITQYRAQAVKIDEEVKQIKNGTSKQNPTETLRITATLMQNIDTHLTQLRQLKAQQQLVNKNGDTSDIDAQIEQYTGQRTQLQHSYDDLASHLNGGRPFQGAQEQTRADQATVAKAVSIAKGIPKADRIKMLTSPDSGFHSYSPALQKQIQDAIAALP